MIILKYIINYIIKLYDYTCFVFVDYHTIHTSEEIREVIINYYRLQP
jgi:hypothetical protein